MTITEPVPLPSSAAADASSSAAADPPPEPGPPALDAGAELEWAKRRWPKQMGRVQIGSRLPELMKWVAEGASIDVWLRTRDIVCKRGVLSRAKDADSLSIVVYTREHRENGKKVRDYNQGTVSDEMFLGGSGGTEAQEADGTWSNQSAWGRSDQGSWGHLSRVTPELARFASVWVDITAECSGPASSIPCRLGSGTMECRSCSDGRVLVKEREMGMLRSVQAAKLGCSSCPDDNPDVERVRQLLAVIDPWAVTDASETAGPTLYRSADACRKKLR